MDELDEIVWGATSIEEAGRFKKIITEMNWLPLPKSVERLQVQFGNDADGDAVVWVVLFIKDDMRKTDQEIKELSELGDRFRNDIINSNTGRWPLIRIAEEESVHDVTAGLA